mgnify:FL=1
MEELVTLRLATYDQLQMELGNLQDEVNTLRNALDSIKVFDIEDSYDSRKNLVFTDYALVQFGELVDSNPHLKFKELDRRVKWDIAEPKSVEGDSNA